MFICINSMLIYIFLIRTRPLPYTLPKLSSPSQLHLDLTVPWHFEKQKNKMSFNNRPTQRTQIWLAEFFLTPAHDMTWPHFHPTMIELFHPHVKGQSAGAAAVAAAEFETFLCDISGRRQRTSKLFTASVPTLCQAVASKSKENPWCPLLYDTWHFLVLVIIFFFLF